MIAWLVFVAVLGTWAACTGRLRHNIARNAASTPAPRWSPDSTTVLVMAGMLAIIPPLGWVWLGLQLLDDWAGRRLGK